MVLLEVESYNSVKQNHKMLVEESLSAERNNLDEKWTKSITVGSKGFVEEVKSILGGLAKGRNIKKTESTYQIREPSSYYNGFFEVENNDIDGENAYCWNFNEV